MDVLAALSDSPAGRTSAELAKICGISTSTCALVLAELEGRTWVTGARIVATRWAAACSVWCMA
jgi:DNA-binding IclR family transcriptional regulator